MNTMHVHVVEDRLVDDAHERSLMPVLNHVQYSLELADHLGSRKFAFDHARCGWVSVDEQRFDRHHYVTIPIDLIQQHGRGWVALKVFKSNFLVSCLKYMLVHFYCIIGVFTTRSGQVRDSDQDQDAGQRSIAVNVMIKSINICFLHHYSNFANGWN